MTSSFHGILHSEVDMERRHTINLTSSCGMQFMRQPLVSFRKFLLTNIRQWGDM